MTQTGLSMIVESFSTFEANVFYSIMIVMFGVFIIVFVRDLYLVRKNGNKK